MCVQKFVPVFGDAPASPWIATCSCLSYGVDEMCLTHGRRGPRGHSWMGRPRRVYSSYKMMAADRELLMFIAWALNHFRLWTVWGWGKTLLLFFLQHILVYRKKVDQKAVSHSRVLRLELALTPYLSGLWISVCSFSRGLRYVSTVSISHLLTFCLFVFYLL